jgi:rhodanese-related sulfurtransferase
MKVKVSLLVGLLLALSLAGLVQAQELGGDFAVVQAAADAYLSSDKAPVISADALFENLNDGDPENDPFILSVRRAEHYALGHVPGAINIPWKEVAAEANLGKLPTDRQIVVYCYTGHTGQIAATVLNLLGYDAINLKFGMMGWTADDEVLATTRFAPETDQRDYRLEQDVNEATETYSFPELETGGGDNFEIVRLAAESWLQNAEAPIVPADAVFENLNDGDAENDPFILSVRGADHYALGHVPGAVNVPWRAVAKPENLAKLPPDRNIVAYCYTGHTGQVAATVLGMLGYDVSNMKFGMMGWTADDAVLATARFTPDVQRDFRLETGTPLAGDFAVVQAAADAYLSSDKAPVISADALFENLNDGDPENNPFILSVRRYEHYVLGHIPGAINIPWKEVASKTSLVQLPTDRQIVVYCYTGHTGQIAATVLNLLGYDAVNLKFGMMGWTADDEVLATARFTPDAQRDYRLEQEVNEPTETYPFPELATGGESDFEIVRLAAEAWLQNAEAPVVPADAVFENLNDGDAENDPFILSVRGADHYALGHVPGAINIPWRTVAKPENLAKLPADRNILAYCYTGHTGQVAATVLGMLGYDVSNMKFGMMGWTADDAVLATARFGPDVQRDFRLETGAALEGDFAVVQAAADAYLTSGKAPVMSADALFENLNDGDADNDPFILSVRKPEHYALGHIPGAINIPWKEVAAEENLAQLPADRPIVVYCYTGHTGQIATTVLNLLGYDAVNLKFGIMGWTADDEVLATARFGPETDGRDYRLEETVNVAAMTYPFPELGSGGADDFEIVRLAAEAWLQNAEAPIVPADAIFENLNDGDAENDPVVLSVRGTDHYQLGHVPGAINVPWKEVVKPHFLTKLPSDRNIAVYCYTGHTGQVAATVLGVLGYNVSNIKYGMMGWTADDAVLATARFSPDVQRDYRLEAAEEPTAEPTEEPTSEPTAVPTEVPTAEPTPEPTAEPQPEPTAVPTAMPEPVAEESGGMGWLVWVVVGAVLAGAGAFFVLRPRT